jgi:hypothetical protein
MVISEIYEKYKIMPQLQMHMLRVAGVASMICDSFEGSIDKATIVSVCLIHDMGNIVKFRLEKFPEGLEPLGLEYWQKVQKEFIEKYGANDYQVTYQILEELKLSDKIQTLVKSNEFAKMSPISNQKESFECKICIYSDARVEPNRITSLDKRLAEVKERYMKNHGVSPEFYRELWESAREIEKQIFSQCKITPGDITEEKVKLIIEELRKFDIQTK